MRIGTGVLLLGIQALLFAGCTTIAPSTVKNENVWTDEVKEMADTGQTYPPADLGGVVFFNRTKPQLKTVQIWLESGKAVSQKIKAYIAGIMPGQDKPESTLAEKISGRWYGLDTNHESAVIFTFRPDGRFTRRAGTEIKTGIFIFEPADAPINITFKSLELPGGNSRQFEFITDDALLFKGGHRDLILFKQS